MSTRTLAVGLALFTLAPAARAADPAPPAEPCATGEVLTLDLAALAAEFAARPWPPGDVHPLDDERLSPSAAPDYAPLLARLGLSELAATVRPAPDRTLGEVYTCALSTTPAQLDAGRPADTLARVDCTTPGTPGLGDGAATSIVRVLRPLGDGRFCALGQIGFSGFESSAPCLYRRPEGTPTLHLELQPLVAKDRMAIRETFYGGTCGSGILRGDDVHLRFHGVEGGRLVTYFDAVLSRGDYESPCPPESMEAGSVVLSGGFPKRIRYVLKTECADVEAGPDCRYSGACKPTESDTRWVFSDGRYQIAPPKP